MIEPVILGGGAAAQALRLALAMYPDDLAPPRRLARGEPLPEADPERGLVVIAHPHALHAPRLLEAADRGYRYAVCEKPAAVDLDQVRALEGLPVRTWICHGYRLLWGPEELKRAWDDGRFGRVFSVEGCYWQAGAVRDGVRTGWKDDPTLGGKSDVLLDLGTHWADLMVHLTGRPPDLTAVRRWYVNAASPHRDTHVHLSMRHGDVASFGSISKAVHGAGNLLELHVLGERTTASWTFSDPDVIVWGERRERRVQARAEAEAPARLAPYHGLGWIEGYGRLIGDVVAHVRHGRPIRAPTLPEHLVVLRALLTAADAEALDAGVRPP